MGEVNTGGGKVRKPLPPEYQAIYEQSYFENRNGEGVACGMSQWFERWLHRKVAATRADGCSVLEIGAGTLNHLDYEKDVRQTYDVIEPFSALYEQAPGRDAVRHFYDDIAQVDPAAVYDRIIAIASFEHILNLDEVVERTKHLLGEDGMLCVAIPNEGRWPWKLAYTLSTGIAFKRRYGLDYSVLMNYEHVNTADEIEQVLRKHYGSMSVKVFGVSRGLCLYRYYCMKQPK